MVRVKVVTAMMWYVQDKVNQEQGKQNKVDRTKHITCSSVYIIEAEQTSY